MGSLEPLSISSVAASRGRRCSPLERRAANTAAASVLPTMLPKSRPYASGMSIAYVASTPTRPAVRITPTVARRPAGAAVRRIAFIDVCRPPSNRIMMSAVVPIACASP